MSRRGADDDLRRRLERVPVPGGDGARERARGLVSGAFADRTTSPVPRRRRGMAVIAATVLAAGTAGMAASAPAGWVKRLVTDASAPPARASLDALPAAGRVLVTGPGGTWIVTRDGSRRQIGAYEDAAWSPRGRFVVVTRGRQLLAIDPAGRPRWALARRGAVRLPRWAAPDGFRIAYLDGRDLRVVAGDGSGDRLLARGVAAVAAAWQPGAAHRLAFVARDGRVVFAEADTRRELWRTRVAGRAAPRDATRTLEFSADGRRLLVAGRRGLRLLDGRGRIVRYLGAPPGTDVTAAALSPDGRSIAVALASRARRAGTIAVWRTRPDRADRALFDAPGAFTGVTWSPDGSWVLAGWPRADQWLFLRAGARAGVAAVPGIAGHFDPGPGAPRGFPAVAGWCCATPR